MIYLGGPYTSKTITQHRINLGKFFAYQTHLYHTMEEPVAIICAPLMTGGYDYTTIAIQPKQWLGICLQYIPHCQAAFFLPGFDQSDGSLVEIERFSSHRIPWYPTGALDTGEQEILKGLLKPMTQYNPIAFWALDWLSTIRY